MAFTYILYSAELDKFYFGSTTSTLEERLKKHLTNHTGFTARAKDWQYVWWKAFPTKEEAAVEERRIKKLKSRKAMQAMIVKKEQE